MRSFFFKKTCITQARCVGDFKEYAARNGLLYQRHLQVKGHAMSKIKRDDVDAHGLARQFKYSLRQRTDSEQIVPACVKYQVILYYALRGLFA